LNRNIVSVQPEAEGNGPFSVFPVVKHAHRTAGFLKIRGVNLDHGEFEDFIFRNPLVNDFKGEAVTVGDAEVLRVSVELKRDIDPLAALDGIKGAPPCRNSSAQNRISSDSRNYHGCCRP
jgi:phenylacetate-CoA ligase